MRGQSEAEKLLNELRTIPKLIRELKLDSERMEATLLSSPQWSDMRVSGGIKRSQDDKVVSIIDMTDYNSKEIDNLICRKKYIIKLIMQIPDLAQRHVLITTYATCQTFDEAIEKLEMNRNTYYMIKRKGSESLNLVLNNTR